MGDQVQLGSPEALEAEGHAKIAEGHTLLSRASCLRAQHTTAPDAVVSVRVVAAELGIKPRVITDAGRRGEIKIDHAGRTPVVSRAEVQRWTTGRKASAEVVTLGDARQAARAAVAARRAS